MLSKIHSCNSTCFHIPNSEQLPNIKKACKLPVSVTDVFLLINMASKINQIIIYSDVVMNMQFCETFNLQKHNLLCIYYQHDRRTELKSGDACWQHTPSFISSCTTCRCLVSFEFFNITTQYLSVLDSGCSTRILRSDDSWLAAILRLVVMKPTCAFICLIHLLATLNNFLSIDDIQARLYGRCL